MTQDGTAGGDVAIVAVISFRSCTRMQTVSRIWSLIESRRLLVDLKLWQINQIQDFLWASERVQLFGAELQLRRKAYRVYAGFIGHKKRQGA